MPKKEFNPEHMLLWDRLFETPPSQTKGFKRAGGFSGTAIKPYWCIERATREWGPVGKGWGWSEEESKTHVHLDAQTLWMSKITVWWREGDQTYHVGPQWGQTMMVVKRMSGDMFIDEEAPKKAVTDGIVKCLSYLGLGGDVHMGMFDDSKYVAEAKVEERKEKDREEAKDRKAKKANGAIDKKPEEPEDNGGDPEKSNSNFDLASWRDRVCANAKLMKNANAVRTLWTTTAKPTVDELMKGDEKHREVAHYVHRKFQERLQEVRKGVSEAAE
jgi:hypothetical protein